MAKLTRIERETKTVESMIKYYCKKHHNPQGVLCEDCNELFSYAEARLSKCKFQNDKPVCANCDIHCYKKDMRSKIVEIMKFSGPRMLFVDPIGSINHLYHSLTNKKGNSK